MATVDDPNVEGFLGCSRLAWAAHLILTQDLDHLESCLEVVFSKNVFQFISDEVLGTAAYQNHDDEDMNYIYNIYLGKLITCLVSHPLTLERVCSLSLSLTLYSHVHIYMMFILPLHFHRSKNQRTWL